MMKCVICSETCTIQAVEKWRNITTKSPTLFSLHTKIHGKKWQWGWSLAQTLIICMINERCQHQNPNGMRTQLEASGTEMKRSTSPSPACLIRDCADPLPRTKQCVIWKPHLLSHRFIFWKVWNSLYIWIKTPASNHSPATEGKTMETSLREATKKHNTIKSFFTSSSFYTHCRAT